MPATEFQPIYISCPSGFQSAYNAPLSWFEEIGDKTYLKILIQPEEYTTIREGEMPKALRTLSRTVLYRVQLKEIGFTVNLSEDNMILRYILEGIQAASVTSANIYPVTVIDYVKPDREAYLVAVAGNSNPYTIRYGVIDVASGSGTNGLNSNRFSMGGLKFTFRQTQLSLN